MTVLHSLCDTGDTFNENCRGVKLRGNSIRQRRSYNGIQIGRRSPEGYSGIKNLSEIVESSPVRRSVV